MKEKTVSSYSRLCAIYRCAKKEGMYLYVDKQQSLEDLPEALQKQLGKTELAMTLLLAPEKKLARVVAADVLSAIDEQGFYLQMPPSIADLDEAQSIREKNNKL